MDEKRLRLPAGNAGDFYYSASFPTGFDLLENWFSHCFHINGVCNQNFLLFYHRILEQLPNPVQHSMQSPFNSITDMVIQSVHSVSMDSCSLLHTPV